MTFEVKPEILTIDEVDGLSADLNALSINTANLLSQTNNLGGSIPQSSKNLSVNLNKTIRIIFGSKEGIVSVYASKNGLDFSIAQQFYGYYNDYLVENGVAIIVGNNIFRYSTDGYSWHSANIFQWQNVYLVRYLGGKFIAVEFNGNTATSNDGITWTIGSQLTFYARQIASGLINGTRVFVALGNYGSNSYSYDGVSWTQGERMLPYGGNFNEVVYVNNRFVAINMSPGSSHISYDGFTWSYSSVPYSLYGLFVVGNSVVATSQYGALILYDGSDSWVDTGISISAYSNNGNKSDNYIYADGKHIIKSYSGNNMISLDGTTWQIMTIPYANYYNRNPIAYGNGKFVAVGDYAIHYSLDGTTWMLAENNVTYPDAYSGVQFDGKVFTVIKTYGDVLSSTDGVTWVRSGQAEFFPVPQIKFNVITPSKTFSEILGVN